MFPYHSLCLLHITEKGNKYNYDQQSYNCTFITENTFNTLFKTL